MVRMYTVGHSSRTAGEFLSLLRAYEINLLIDVRRYPGSKRHPQFNEGDLKKSLAAATIGYRHEVLLGGRRGPPAPDNPNTGWRVMDFQAYADHLNSGQAQAALRQIIKISEEQTVVLMCAEVVPWRCHRRILADHLIARDITVHHIIDSNQVRPHTLQQMAIITEDRTVIYPDTDQQQELFD